MKILKYFLSICFCVAPSVMFGAGPVATTAGGNLTAYNPNGGLQNNNNWATQTNGRYNQKSADVKADFGNCNSLIIRCAQPKCSGGGCVNIDVARPIVSGCVKSNSSCKQYGNDLIEYISAQMVADAQAEIQQQEFAAQQAAAEAAAAASAAQGNEQLQAMQAQMQQMQYEMQQQNSETIAQLQNALEEQKQMTADAIAKAQEQSSVPQSVVDRAEMNELTVAQQVAVDNQVPPEVLERQKIAGQIMTDIENAEKTLLGLKEVMKETFEYAGCDSRGNNCRGPKRVEKFKNIANGFFDPYYNVVDEIEEALYTAYDLGIDISDVIMMLDNSCNRWGKYYCYNKQGDGSGTVDVFRYLDNKNCVNGKSVYNVDLDTKGGHDCQIGKPVPASDRLSCNFVGVLSDNAEVQEAWLNPEISQSGTEIRVDCANSVLDSGIFGRRRRQKTQSAVDIDILQRILEQDAPTFTSYYSNPADKLQYCALVNTEAENLRRYATNKTLPDKVCVPSITGRPVAPLHGFGNSDLVPGSLSEKECKCKALGKTLCLDTDIKEGKCDESGCKDCTSADCGWYTGLIDWIGGECKCKAGLKIKGVECVPESIMNISGKIYREGDSDISKEIVGFKIEKVNDVKFYYCPIYKEEGGSYGNGECYMKGSNCVKEDETNTVKCCNNDNGCS